MVILGVEAAAGVAGAALLRDGRLLAEVMYNNKKTHSQTLLPQIEQVLEEGGYCDRFSEIDGIAVTAGPGSFTGLRIGSATVKGLAYAWKVPVLGVPTLDAMAVSAYGQSDLVCPIMDARRSQVYTGIYSFDETATGSFPDSVRLDASTVMNRRFGMAAIGIDELVERLNEMGRPVTFLGDGVPVHRAYLEEKVNARVRFLPCEGAAGRASAVATLGAVYLAEGYTQDSQTHLPEYLRPSQAERVKHERENS